MPFQPKPTPRSDSANLEPSEPIFYPQILEPRFEVRGGAHVVDPSAPPTNISWNHVFDGAATFSFDAATPFHGNASQRIAMASGTHAAVTNRGLNNEGLLLHAAKDYTGYVFAKAARPTKLRVALRDHVRNATLASVELSISAGDWRMYNFSLTPSARMLLEYKGGLVFFKMILKNTK